MHLFVCNNMYNFLLIAVKISQCSLLRNEFRFYFNPSIDSLVNIFTKLSKCVVKHDMKINTVKM